MREMPSRNVVKINTPEAYYHVYARGASKNAIFIESQDYVYFQNLFARYLSAKPVIGKDGVPYPHLVNSIELLCFCLMPTHFHILLYQISIDGMRKLMQSVMTSYSRYHNLKYGRTGPLFESRYKGVRINQDAHLEHISRYIHMNPSNWLDYEYSSISNYLDGTSPEWLKPKRIMENFTSTKAYLDFMLEYQDQKQNLRQTKAKLADASA